MPPSLPLVDLLFARAEALFSARKLTRCAAMFRRLLAAPPDHPLATRRLANAQLALGRVTEARRLYGRAIRLDPADPAARRQFGNLFWEAGRLDAAARAYRVALALTPDDPAGIRGRIATVPGGAAAQAGPARDAAVAAPPDEDDFAAVRRRLPGVTITRWLSQPELEAQSFVESWNREGHDHDNVFWVVDGNFPRCERYVADTGLIEDLHRCAAAARLWTGRGIDGCGAELAAGALWLTPHLFAGGTVERLTCVEYSIHRLFVIGPAMLEHYRVPTDRMVLALGSFYRLEIEDGGLDFVVLCQGLHHADRPLALLREVARVLKPGGIAIVIGEPRPPLVWTVKDAVLHRRRTGRFRRGVSIFAPDPILGDHYHLELDYRRMFSAAGLAAMPRPGAREEHRSYVLCKPVDPEHGRRLRAAALSTRTVA